MIGKLIVSGLVAGSLALASPAVAQDETQDGAGEEEALAAMVAVFQPEPLTAEEQARLPLARGIVDKMMPPGTLGEMMGSMFDGMLGPIMEMATDVSASDVADLLGVESDELSLDDEQAAEAAAILDPALQERSKRMTEVMPAILSKAMETMEPGMRKALSETYAVYFDKQELTDIDAFFSTKSGVTFARKSMMMSSDPRFMGAMMQSMPAMMGSFGEMEQEMKAAMADLPEPRAYPDLTEDERRRLAELTGLGQDQISAGMKTAAETRAAETVE